MSANNISIGPLVPLPGQPLCRHYTGAGLHNLTGDYSCRCRANVPFERWSPSIDRWPCRRRHLLGLAQHECEHADYGSQISSDVDEQLTEMAIQAVT